MLAIVDPLFVLPEKKYCQMIRKVVKEWLLSLEVFCERQFKWNDPLLTSDRNLGIKKKDLWKAWILWLDRW